MNMKDVVKAWRNPAFRSTLSAAELAQLPGNPAGMIELSGTALDAVAGGAGRGHSGKSSRSGKSGKSSRSGKSGKSH
ncbi:MAG: hypothetical protein DMF90_05925 [Acidobacteria bacterium]|nr:MAG: hypothetical protein DMF90_05925 [Acidobacteriota bacterium]